ncbi:putative histone-lysine N-methyltransferase, H3 lysine-9 specific SUVH9 [Platanthera zijinensis]|uniref:Histone-lysine N-methyltransferase, H3 lysine-9 specific SUVH9 n=1 Tax=Platanthera zijinensis TaxID=2320716 RepID=A0AAP0BAS2_9ASPA
MASPSSSSHLNFAFVPKIEPKAEPLELDFPISPIGRMPNLTHGISELTSLSPATDGEEKLFTEYHRLISTLLPTSGATGSSDSTAVLAVPIPDSPAPILTAGMSVNKRRRRDRSSEMVRICSLREKDRIHFRNLIRRARITFESLRLLIKQVEAREKDFGIPRKSSRPDLKAAALMTNCDLWLNRHKRIIGSIPGICVGDIYFFRAELCVIGLHGHIQGGIDYVSASRSSTGEPIATSIVASGGYEDDEDGGDVLIYSGHGGREGNLRKMCVSQKLERGNLALERSMRYGIEIRVVRGMKIDRGPNGKVYVYDGLYKVVDCWMDGGKSGLGVYKYKLLRIEGQEEMGSSMFKQAATLQVSSLSARKGGYFCSDISMGRESLPVSLYNDLDDDKDPLHFQYLAHPLYPPDIQSQFHGDGRRGCECVTDCSSECYCAALNGGEFAYDAGGVLVRGKPLIYECGTACMCPPSCPNRESQKGIRRRLEVFRSNEIGWGVRSWDLVQAGTFVCEYSGIVLTKEQTELLSFAGENLVHPSRFPARWAEWGDVSDVFPNYMTPRYPLSPELSFSLDVSRARNLACYLSHSCSPNVFMQFVLYDHHNPSFPHLMIFAMENIPPLRELSIDYGVMDEWAQKLIAM